MAGPVSNDAAMVKPADPGGRNRLAVCCRGLLAIVFGGWILAGWSEPFALPGVKHNGTGFVVDDRGLVLTSHHVAAGCGHLAMRRGNARVGASLVSADPDADLALLMSGGPLPAAPADFRTTPLVKAGEKVVLAGFPQEVSGTGFLRAASAEVANPADGAGRFRLSVPVGPGNSGGPVLDRSGRVVGVAAGTLRSSRTGAPVGNPGVVIGAEAIQGFLRRSGVAIRVGEARELSLEMIARRARDSTVLVECL